MPIYKAISFTIWYNDVVHQNKTRIQANRYKEEDTQNTTTNHTGKKMRSLCSRTRTNRKKKLMKPQSRTRKSIAVQVCSDTIP